MKQGFLDNGNNGNNEQKSYNNLRLSDKLKPMKEKESLTQWSQRELADICNIYPLL